MITREQALELIREHVKNENIVKHMLATEALMSALARRFKVQGSRFEAKEEFNEEEWAMAGLLHDGDYCDQVPVEKQGVQVTLWTKERGYEVPENVVQAMAAHNQSNTGVEPKTKMDWALFCGDSLTGLIVATTLVRPDKKLANVEVSSVMKKFKNKAFAAGTRREDIALCEEKLGIALEEFVGIGLKAMQGIASDLGL